MRLSLIFGRRVDRLVARAVYALLDAVRELDRLAAAGNPRAHRLAEDLLDATGMIADASEAQSRPAIVVRLDDFR